jgi:dihydroxyacetone kinase
MEMGVGIHGEPGRRRVPLASGDRMAEEMVAAIAGDLGHEIRGGAFSTTSSSAGDFRAHVTRAFVAAYEA